MLELLEFLGRIAIGLVRVVFGLLEAVAIVGDIWSWFSRPKPERDDRDKPPPES